MKSDSPGRSWWKKSRNTLNKAKAGAEAIASILKNVDHADEDNLVDAFADLASITQLALDSGAQSHTVGVVSEGGLGLYLFKGRYLRYVRKQEDQPPCLILGGLTGLGERISLSAGLRAYTISASGPHSELAASRSGWRSAEAGLGPVAAGVMSGGKSICNVRGNMAWVGLDISLGPVPISGLALLQVKERSEKTVELNEAQAERIEAVVQSAPDMKRSRKLVDVLTKPAFWPDKRNLSSNR